MKQERADRCGSDPLAELWELEGNFKETTIEELEGFLTELRTKKEEGQDVDDLINITEQAIQIKIEEKLK